MVRSWWDRVGRLRYVAFMPHTLPIGQVTVHYADLATVIVASGDWTEDQWDEAIPATIRELPVDDWDYRELPGGVEMWFIPRPQEALSAES